MRVVTNDKRIERNKRNAQLLFLVSIAGVFGSLFIGRQVTEASAAFAFQCVMMITLLTLVVTSVRMTNRWVRQPYPWEVIKDSLKGIGSDNVLYNYMLPADHVLISPNGIFAMTTRFQERPQKLVDDTWKTRFEILTFMRQEQLGNPTKDAKLKAVQTEAFLRELLNDPSIQVNPVIVFTHPQANVEIEGTPTVPVVFADPDRKKGGLKDFFRGLKSTQYPTLSKEQIAELDDALLYKD
jgi:hypothetical protein